MVGAGSGSHEVAVLTGLAQLGCWRIRRDEMIIDESV